MALSSSNWLRLLFTVICLLFIPSVGGAEPHVVTVNQVTDISSTAAKHMFRFEPDILQIAPGETVRFINSRSGHTVHSQKGFWPENVPTIAIAGRQSAMVTFDTPGIYGITCKRHGQYGMVMVIRVGDATASQIDIDALSASTRAKNKYHKLLSHF